MEWIEITGRTVASAVEAALDELGVDESDLEYEVLEEPRGGLLGRREARIRARVKPVSREKPGERRRRSSRGEGGRSEGRGGGGRGGGRGRRPASAPTRAPAAEGAATNYSSQAGEPAETGGSLASDEQLAALREKLSGGA